MAIRGPFKRWRLVEPIRDLDDVTKILRELDLVYEQLVYVLEQGSDDAPGTAPGDAEYILGAADVDLPNGRVLVAGQNTTVDLGTPGEASIDVSSAPPTGTAGGDLGGTYPNPIVDGLIARPFFSVAEPAANSLILYNTVQNNWLTNPASGDVAIASSGAATVSRIHGNPFDSGTPSANDFWIYDSFTSQWVHIPISGDATVGAGGLLSVDGIRGNTVESGVPVAGDVYRWSGSQFVRWSPKYLHASMSANQVANLAGGNHVEFNTADVTSGHVTVSTGAGQARGIFPLPSGVYRLSCELDCSYSAANSFTTFRWAVAAGGGVFGADAANEPLARAVNVGAAQNAEAIRVVASGTENVEVRITNSQNLTSINSSRSRVMIEALS